MISAHVEGFVLAQALVDLFVAVLCGGMIGLDRQRRGRPAGIRTCIVVTLTTALFVTVAQAATNNSGDPSRVIAGIVTGVGFLGAGVIFTQGRRVQGITTAALIWALAAIGITIGVGFPITAVIVTALLMAILLAIDWVERAFPWLRQEAIPGRED